MSILGAEFAWLMFFLCLVSSMIMWMNLSLMRQQLDASRSEVLNLRNEFTAISSGNIGVGKKIVQHDNVLNKLELKLDELFFEFSNPKSYDQAAKMIEKGIDMDDVSTTCELSRGEADLLALMRRNKKPIKKSSIKQKTRNKTIFA